MSQRGEGIARIEGFSGFLFRKLNLAITLGYGFTRISRKFAEAELLERQKHEERETGTPLGEPMFLHDFFFNLFLVHLRIAFRSKVAVSVGGRRRFCVAGWSCSS